MSGARIQVTLDDAAYQQALTALGGALNHGRIMRPIGVALVEEVQQRFDRGVDVWGVRWQALHPAYALIKRGPGILRASQMLQRSITYQTAGNRVDVGSNRIYAAVHQFGATIKPVRAKALAFHLGGVSVGPRGGKKTGSVLVKAKSVTIPARPYLGFGPNDQRAVMGVLTREIARIAGS